MFERFTAGARGVVKGAVALGEHTDARMITEEHMLLALLDLEGTRASGALAALGFAGRRRSVENALAAARRRGGLSQADTDALAGIGIDVGEIVSKVEETHGNGAMRAGERPIGRSPGRRGFTPAAKATLEKSLRIALGRKEKHVGDEHILLALTVLPGVVSEVLADHGVTYEAVEGALG
jgi:ATP-dependent Clp protease ATP-binding subunit ClpA